MVYSPTVGTELTIGVGEEEGRVWRFWSFTMGSGDRKKTHIQLVENLGLEKYLLSTELTYLDISGQVCYTMPAHIEQWFSHPSCTREIPGFISGSVIKFSLWDDNRPHSTL